MGNNGLTSIYNDENYLEWSPHEYDGQYYSFSSPLGDDEFFSLIPENSTPSYYTPIIDEHEGLCVGYMHKGTSTLYDIYDYNGTFVNRFEPPLESPLLDPLDLILIGPVFLKGIKAGYQALKFVTKRGAIVRISSFIVEHWITLLRGRMKWGLSPAALKFASTPARHMAETARYVPLSILEMAIRFGRRLPDLKGASGRMLQRYEIDILRSKRIQKGVEVYENKKYTLEVVVDESTWTIVHFLYK